jgi:outer membrane protein assembly factor BamB/V8-like Glu-specific endopeptidase
MNFITQRLAFSAPALNQMIVKPAKFCFLLTLLSLVMSAAGQIPEGYPIVRVNGVLSPNNSFAMTNDQPVQVTIQSSYPEIRFTTNGVAADVTSELYTGPFSVRPPVVINATGVKDGFLESPGEPVSITIIPRYPLADSTSGGGHVTFDPPGGTYLSNTTVTATATADPGWVFFRWEENGQPAGEVQPRAVLMDRARTLKAIFGTTLTVGSSFGQAEKRPQVAYHEYGSQALVWLVPTSDRYFVQWILGGVAQSLTNNPYSIRVTNANIVLNAQTALLNGKRSLTALWEGDGTVMRSPHLPNYTTGDRVQLTATAAEDYQFIEWLGDAAGNAATVEVVMDANKVVRARFVKKPLVQITQPLADTVINGALTAKINASVVVEEGSVSRVQFYANNELIGEASNVLSLDWRPEIEGEYSLTAVAFTTVGTSASSPPITVRVLFPPRITKPLQSQVLPVNFKVFWDPGVQWNHPMYAEYRHEGTNYWNSIYDAKVDLGRARPELAGSWRLYLSNSVGEVLSPPFSLTVVQPGNPVGQLAFGADGRFPGAGVSAGYDGTSYIVTYTNVLARNLDGSIKWKYPADVRAAPAIGSDGTLYLTEGPAGRVTALNPETGLEKWHQSPINDILGGCAIGSDGAVYVAAGANLYALRPANGSVKWTYSLAGAVSQPPTVGTNGLIYVIDASRFLYAIKPDGTKSFSANLGSDDFARGQPVPVGDGNVVVSMGNQGLVAIGPDGSQRWAQPAAPCYATPAVGPGGVIYVGAESKVYAVNPAGSVKWDRTLGGNVGTSISIDGNGNLYCVVLNPSGNHLRVFDSNGGNVSSNALPNWSSFDPPTLTADSLLYISSPQGAVPYVAYAAPADSFWPTHRKSPTAHGNAAGLLGDLKWRFLADGDLYSSPMVDPDGKLWITANNQLVSFSNATPVFGPVWGNSPSVVSRGKRIYHAQISGYAPAESYFAVYDSVQKQEIFSQRFPGFISSFSQVAVDASGKAYIATVGDDSASGRLYTWKEGEAAVTLLATFPATAIGAALLVADGILVPAGRWLHKISYGGAVMKSYDQYYGEVNFDFVVGGPAIGENGEIYMTSLFGYLYALRPDFSEIWPRRHLGYRTDSSPVIGPDGTIYVHIYGYQDSSDNVLQAFDPANGQAKWAQPIRIFNDYGYSSPVVTQDRTIYSAGGRTAHAIRDLGDHGELLWKFLAEGALSTSSPVVDRNGTVYFASEGGSVYALHGSAAPANSWSMLSGNPERTRSAIPLNPPPTISITNPIAGAVFFGATNITIKVVAADTDAGFVKRVDFLDGDVVIGSSTVAPFDFTTTLGVGAHALRARAVDNGDASTLSAVINVTVNSAAKPVIQLLAPASSDPFQAPTNITILAEATDADGLIIRVDFYSDSGFLGSVTGPTSANRYAFTWVNPPAGLRTIFARAFDNAGSFTDSALLNVTVAQPVATSFRLAQATYTFLENAGTINITVIKAGAVAATVNFATQTISADPQSDFTPVVGTLTFGATEMTKSISIRLLNELVPDGEKRFEIRLSSPTSGASLSDPSVAVVAIQDDDAALVDSSVIQFRPSSPRATPSGSLQVHLTPSQVGAWRFPWEFGWRLGDATASNLDPGDYPVEFRPTLNYVTPDVKTNSVLGGLIKEVVYGYGNGSAQEGGSLSIYFENLAALTTSGLVPMWRVDGEAWRLNGDVAGPLLPGLHVIEFLEFGQSSGWISPNPREALVQAGVSASIPVNYMKAPPTPSGVEVPAVLTYTAVRAGQIASVNRQPYPMVGQLRTPAGWGSGTAVRDRVVLTAAHVLFDDVTTNYINPSSIMWFQEKIAGEYEPSPIYPAGYYVHTNYLQKRTVERQSGLAPGVATAESQQWDVAALYFNEPVARDGQTGYLLSNAAENEWLIGSKLKQLVGYPLIDPNKGKMHDIRPLNYLFSYEAGYSNLFLSSQFLSYPGNSGGPLWVAYSSSDGYFPAGVYLGSRVSGGKTNSVVRAIDSLVASLINRAQSSAELAANFAGGGVDRLDSGSFSSLVPGTLYVVLEPAAAVTAGARWRVAQRDTTYRMSGSSLVSPTADIVLEFAAATGFATPSNRTVKVIGNQTNTITITYSGKPTLTNPILTAERKLRFSVIAGTGSFVVETTDALQATPQLTSWSPVVTNAAPFTFESAVPGPGEKRYYRARLQSN